MTRANGYYRFPTINDDTIVFVCEDDLWSVPVSGGIARPLTAGTSSCSHPLLSPDGSQIAFVGRDEGEPEVYVMPADGGPTKRISFLGSAVCTVAGWSSDSLRIAFTSDCKSFDYWSPELYEIDAIGGMPRALNIGHAVSIATANMGPVVIGRNNNDPARWKRYRGGTAGELWIDPKGRGTFNRLINLKGNLASPMLIAGRVYFLSDHEGIGNIYSCKPDGGDLRRHTHHEEYYVRFPSSDGKRIVYTAGADVYIFDSRTEQSKRVEITVAAAPRQSVRKWVEASHNVQDVSVHPKGHSIGIISRGQPFTMPFWEDAAIQHGAGSKVRYRCLQWLYDGERFVVVNDESGYERLQVHHADQSEKPQFVTTGEFGRVIDLVAAPNANKVALCNHKHELILVDLDKKKWKVIDHAPADRITGVTFSPCGSWLAYSYPGRPGISHIRVYNLAQEKKHDITRPLIHDYAPSWDPDGRYIYFLSSREFNPVYDTLQFDLGFPFGIRPYLVTLRKNVANPFTPIARALFDGGAPAAAPAAAAEKDAKTGKREPKKTAAATKKKDNSKAVEAEKSSVIDFDGIEDRVLAFPVQEGQYYGIAGLQNRAVFLKWPVQGIKRGFDWHAEDQTAGELWAYDFKEQRAAVLANNVRYFHVAMDRRTLVYHASHRLRVIDGLTGLVDYPPAPAGDEVNRKSGWIDLRRAHGLIEPHAEWQQMFDETWRLQRDHFWTENMSDVDWDVVYQRYARLLPRVNSRIELSDLLWEMHGELGTSHAYEFGGDHRWGPSYRRGFLGADLAYDEATGGYKITKILRGDSWDADVDSPLAKLGSDIKVGDVITAVGGRPVSKTCSVDELLLNCSGRQVMLTITEKKGKHRHVAVRALPHEKALRYRAWVEANRRYVHEKTGGKVGYVHIPNMGPWGFAEFHRGYLSEVNRDGLIVDVRNNGGGHVSALLLEKLRRKRVGYNISRWGMPEPYPTESVAGPIVGITNQFAGSDGDIFSHCFKLYELGPLVGKRTWGGVIGIWPRHILVDGTVTTQPEFSFWFTDKGWGVENYGTDPDYDVDFAPQDYRSGRDPQMEKALELVLDSLKKKPFKLPKFDQRPSLPLPKLKKPAPKR